MSFSEFENANPYAQASREFPPTTPPGNDSSTQFTVLGILYIVLAIISLAVSILFVISGLIQYTSGKALPPPDADDAQRTGFYVGFFGVMVACGISGLLQSLVALAGINMLRRKGSGIAKVGAIVMCIPCLTSCGLLGIPFGIWGIIALHGQSAKQHFH